MNGFKQSASTGRLGAGTARWLLLGALALAASGCGGGGNSPSGSPSPPPAIAPPPPPPPPPPPASPPPQDPPDIDAHLTLTNAITAQSTGLTGAGNRVAVVDTGVNRSHPTLQGRVVQSLNYVDPARNDLDVDDVVGHGTWVSQILAGDPVGDWPGGIARGVEIVSARIINDERPEDDGSGQGNEVTGSGTGNFFRAMNADLIAANARITNNSWGGLYWNQSGVTQSFYDAYAPYVLDFGGLVVFATGNSGFDEPSDTASLPSKSGVTAGLERGWLAVAALDPNNPTELTSWSNRCGVAMNYCLVAPGRVIVTGEDDVVGGPTSYWIIGGTSLSTPMVSGAAAMVWEAFPWFDNDLVRQTLLGTATDLGDPGPDPVFGYGLLDIGKAVGGPARFDWGDVTASFSGTSRWSNAIDGAGGLIKRGTGTLVLGDADGEPLSSGYQGQTRVEAGRLVLEGSRVGNSAAQVLAAGTLQMTDSALGSLDNRGTLNLTGGDNVILGDYLHRDGATFGFRLGSRLFVEGDMTIAGGEARLLGVMSGYVYDDREQLVSVDGVLSGEFDTLGSAPGVFLDGRLVYEPKAIWLEIERIDVSAAGLSITAASLGSAQRLDGAFARLDGQLRDNPGSGREGGGFMDGAARFQRVQGRSLAEDSVASLSGELHATQIGAVLGSVEVGARSVRERMAQRRDAEPGSFVSNAWVASLDHAGSVSSAGFSEASVSLAGSVVGVDQAVGSFGVLGLSLGKARLDAGLEGLAGSSRSMLDEAALYAGWDNGTGYLQGRLAAGRLNQMLDRQLLLGTELFAVGSRYAAGYTSADIELGMPVSWARSGLRVTPFVGSQWLSLRQDAFSETGAFGFGLRADARSSTHWQAGAGLELSHDWRGAAGVSHRLGTRMQYQRVLEGGDAGFDASFTGLEQYAPVSGIGLPGERVLLGVTLESRLSPSTRFGLGLQDDLSGRGEQVQASANLRVAF